MLRELIKKSECVIKGDDIELMKDIELMRKMLHKSVIRITQSM